MITHRPFSLRAARIGALLVILVAVPSCDESGTTQPGSQRLSNPTQRHGNPKGDRGLLSIDSLGDVSEAGDIHNGGLDEIDYVSIFSDTSASWSERTATFLGQAAAYVADAYEGDSIDYITVAMIDSNAAHQCGLSFNSGGDAFAYVTTSSAYTTYVSSTERNLISELVSHLQDDFTGMSRNQICQALMGYAQEAINTYDTTSWDSLGGAAFGGVAHIMKRSAEYWDGHMTGNEGDYDDPNGPVYTILSLDCAGYIWGWINAVVDDIDSPGGLKPEGQWRRIRKGASQAIAWSGLRWAAGKGWL